MKRIHGLLLFADSALVGVKDFAIPVIKGRYIYFNPLCPDGTLKVPLKNFVINFNTSISSNAIYNELE